MKKIFLLVCLSLSIVCNLVAQTESDYMFIKDGLKWVENYTVQKGGKYTGFVNAANQPTCYGKLVDASGKAMIGQFKNGKTEGVATFDAPGFSYFGEVSNDEANGIGRQTLGSDHVASLFKNNKSADGLACATTGAVIIKNGKPAELGLEYYPKVIYENNLEKIKSLCAQNNIRYVENTTIGEYTYSGGWKNAQPNFYGAYKMRNNQQTECGIGYIVYDESTKAIKPDNTKPHEVFFEDYYTISYKKFEVNSIGDTILTYQSKNAYEYSIVGKDGKYKRNDVFHFGNSSDNFSKFYKYVNGHPWGLSGSNRYITEGFLDRDDATPSTCKVISDKGELHHFNNGSRSITFPNGDKLEVSVEKRRYGYFLGKYISSTGEYTIGWFSEANSNTNDDAYYKTIKVLYGKTFFSDGELKQEINNESNSWLKGIEDYKNKVQLLISAPDDGVGTFTFPDGDVYSGEWKNHLMNGNGKRTLHNGDVLKGTFVNGDLVNGIMVKHDGTIMGGTWENGELSSTDSIIYPNGTYKKYKEIDGKRVEEKKDYYMIEYISDEKTFGTFYTTKFDEADIIFEGIYDKHARVTFTNNKYSSRWDYQKGDYLEGDFHYSQRYLSCKTITRMRKTFSNGIYEGGVGQNGNSCVGKYLFKNGRTFEGYFTYDGNVFKQTCGEGTLILADGTMIRADFGENMTCSLGKVIYTNKDEYNGAMHNGVREGKGEYLFANGDKITGIWSKNNIGNEETTYQWSDGRKFIGIIKGNKPGKGLFYNADGSVANKKQVKEWSFQAPVMPTSSASSSQAAQSNTWNSFIGIFR